MDNKTNNPSDWWKEYGYYPIWLQQYNAPSFVTGEIPYNQKVIGGATIDTNLENRLSFGLSGINTTYGNQYGANFNANLLDNKAVDENGNYIARVGVNYDLKSKTYTPMFILGYNNMDSSGGWGANVSMDNRMQPQYQINYQRRF